MKLLEVGRPPRLSASKMNSLNKQEMTSYVFHGCLWCRNSRHSSRTRLSSVLLALLTVTYSRENGFISGHVTLLMEMFVWWGTFTAPLLQDVKGQRINHSYAEETTDISLRNRHLQATTTTRQIPYINNTLPLMPSVFAYDDAIADSSRPRLSSVLLVLYCLICDIGDSPQVPDRLLRQQTPA